LKQVQTKAIFESKIGQLSFLMEQINPFTYSHSVAFMANCILKGLISEQLQKSTRRIE